MSDQKDGMMAKVYELVAEIEEVLDGSTAANWERKFCQAHNAACRLETERDALLTVRKEDGETIGKLKDALGKAETERDSLRLVRDKLIAERDERAIAAEEWRIEAVRAQESLSLTVAERDQLRADLAKRTAERNRLEHEVLDLQAKIELAADKRAVAAERERDSLRRERDIWLDVVTRERDAAVAAEKLAAVERDHLRAEIEKARAEIAALTEVPVAVRCAAQPVTRPDGAVVHPSPAAALEERLAQIELDVETLFDMVKCTSKVLSGRVAKLEGAP